MAHWGPAAGPHGQRGLGGERTGQGAGGRQGPGTWDTEASSQCESRAPGEDPTHAQGTAAPIVSHQQGTAAWPFPLISTRPRIWLSPPGTASPPFTSRSSQFSTFQCSLLHEDSTRNLPSSFLIFILARGSNSPVVSSPVITGGNPSLAMHQLR